MPVFILTAKDNNGDVKLLRDFTGDIKHERGTPVHEKNNGGFKGSNPIIELLAVPFTMLPNVFPDEVTEKDSFPEPCWIS
jgi:hypothetical protein